MIENERATLKLIAEKLGVSVTTVSRVMSGQARSYRISRKTEQAVSQLAKEYNFVPNPMARGLRLKNSMTIGLIIPDISNPFFAGIARQVSLGASKSGYSVLLCDSQESLSLEVQSIGLLRNGHIQGAIVCPVGQEGGHLLQCAQAGLPVVLVDRYFPAMPLPYVASDNYRGAREAMLHLIENGHRKIACLQGLRGTSPNELRVKGFRDALTACRLPIDEGWVVGDSFEEQTGYIETKILLRTRKDVTAIFALGNLIALGVLRALEEEGCRIPEDFSVVAFDEQPYSAYLATPMTTVAQPFSEMGEIAVRLLLDRIHSPQRGDTDGILLPTTLVKRRSVKRIS